LLSTFLEESSRSTGPHRTNYTCTLIDPYGEDFLAFPLGFGGAIFAVSNDEPPRDEKTDQERATREERNTNRKVQRVDLENTEEDLANTSADG
jgi:hypothetical protein